MASETAGEQAGTLAHLTRELAHCCVAKEMEIFRRFGLSTGEGNALLAIADGAGSPSTLAEQLGVVRSRISPLVQNLVNKEFLVRAESVVDRRVKELKLTRRGEQVALDADRYRLGFHQRLLERFDEKERKLLFATLSRLYERMTEVRRGMKEAPPPYPPVNRGE